MNEIMKSKSFKIAAIVVAFFLVAILSFAGGIKVGARKALFSSQWGKNYERNFMGEKFDRNNFKRPMGPMGKMHEKINEFEGRDFRNAHGLFGTIISISGNSLAIKDRDGMENAISITNQTAIRSGRENLQISDLKVGNQIAVIGNPGENGTVNADLIRIFPGVNNPGNTTPADNLQNKQ